MASGGGQVTTFTPMKPSTFPSLESTLLKDAQEARHHAKGSVELWKKINLFLVVPATALVAWYCIPKELDHMHHLHEHPNEFQAYPYLRKRKNVGHPSFHAMGIIRIFFMKLNFTPK
jgi:hypothetical protein